MPEGVAGLRAAAVGDQDLGVDGFAEGAVDEVVGEVQDLDEEVVLDAPADDRGHAEELVRGVRESPEARGEDVAKGRGEAGRVGAGGDKLLHVEGVSLRPGVDAVDESRCRDVSENRPDLEPHVVVGEPRDLEALDVGRAFDLDEPREKGVAAVELVAPVGPDDQDPLCADVPDQEGEELAGGAVGPVEVFDGEDDRALVRQAPERPEEGLVDVASGPLRPELRRGGLPGGREGAELVRDPEELFGGRVDGRDRVGFPVRGRAKEAPDRADRLDDRREREGVPSAIPMQPPARTRAPPPARSRAAARTRVFPTPASPPTSTAWPRPVRAPSRARMIAAISALRPMICGLTTRTDTRPS